MDGWMEHHLRLAERQGLLTGPHISQVQSEALSILVYLDEVAKYQREAELFKQSLITRPEYKPEEYFPERFGGKAVTTTTASDDDDDDVEYDYTEVEWKGPSDVDEEELNRMLSLLQQAQGKVSMEQTDQHASGEWV